MSSSTPPNGDSKSPARKKHKVSKVRANEVCNGCTCKDNVLINDGDEAASYHQRHHPKSGVHNITIHTKDKSSKKTVQFKVSPIGIATYCMNCNQCHSSISALQKAYREKGVCYITGCNDHIINSQALSDVSTYISDVAKNIMNNINSDGVTNENSTVSSAENRDLPAGFVALGWINSETKISDLKWFDREVSGDRVDQVKCIYNAVDGIYTMASSGDSVSRWGVGIFREDSFSTSRYLKSGNKGMYI